MSLGEEGEGFRTCRLRGLVFCMIALCDSFRNIKLSEDVFSTSHLQTGG